MTIVEEASTTGTKMAVYDAVRTIIDAEREDEEWRNSGSNKNTHFEFQFGENSSEEVYVYFERLDTDTGLEVMFWVDEDYFDTDTGVERLELSDGGDTLVEFTDVVLSYVSAVLTEYDIEYYISPEYHTVAPPSIVFADSYFLN